jgi:outer membrane immunogenic protein
MKRFVLAGALLAAAAAPALAADLARPAPVYVPPPVVVPIALWMGFYVGVNAGVAINDSSYNLYPTGCFVVPTVLCGGPLSNNPLRIDSNNFTRASFTGGVQAGYNWQADIWLLGVETDFNYKGENETDSVNRILAAPLVGNFIHSVSDKLGWFGTVRARAGVLVMPTLLLYGTGGLAYGHVESNTSVAFTAAGDTYIGSTSTTKAGWTAGAGAEWRFAPNFSVKVEYLRVDLGSNLGNPNVCVTPAVICGGFVPAPSYQTDLRVRDNIIRAGVNYRFGG